MAGGSERPDPPWLHLLSLMERGWREKQILVRGRDPDPHIEDQLRMAGCWPEPRAETNE